ncbi:TonB-dependent receptor plug domain-containing protein [Pelagicoccus sp. SDUM812005]|uniref:TonB-dependent receptor plug domain-containing protein n=1 Tax=Pelagicoccus sp. SDUM812005 TaxID=3041257 RepID=UPI00280DF005|nr:TonB-dependent receptor plug domain-containing protein [Pelagicoccus sp. SDUM812005]MDQ8183293.1 hypothetical protein [Pelagicoccus sp. SDUM812005]
MAATGVLYGQEEEEEEIFVLSPFEVNADSDDGYRATQTLAGGRLNSKIEDIGTSIQAVTKQMLEDLAATSTEELLVYTTNTDTAGPSGNFTGTDSSGVQNDGEIRQNPAAGNRIRALAAPTRTRGFFETDIPFDSYITDRVDIQRGANSFLFGLGSPGGIINSDVAQANFSDSTELGLRLSTDEFDGNLSTRVDFNVNRVLAEDRFAVRFAALKEDQEYLQNSAFRDSTRFYGAMKWRLLDESNTFLKLNFETGKIKSTPPSSLGPLETLSTLIDNTIGIEMPNGERFSLDGFGNVVNGNVDFEGLDANGEQIDILTSGTAAGSEVSARFWANVFDGTSRNGLPAYAFQTTVDGGAWGAPDGNGNVPIGNITYDPDGNWTGSDAAVRFIGMPNYGDLVTGYTSQGLTNLETFDFRKNLYSGGLDRYDNDFDALNLSFTTESKDGNFGLELAYDAQNWSRNSFVMGGSPTIYFDVNKTLPIGPNDLFGATNPNYGRPFIASKSSNTTDLSTDRETIRATAFAQIDFEDKFDNGILRWLGSHRAVGLFDENRVDSVNKQYRMASNGNNAAVNLIQPDATAFQRQNSNIFYVGPQQLNVFTDPNLTIEDVIITGVEPGVTLEYPAGLEVPLAYFDMTEGVTKVGTYTPEWVNFSGRMEETKVSSQALNLQSFLLKDHLVANLGWRKDKWENAVATAPADAEGIRLFGAEDFNLDSSPINTVEGNNFSYNLVAKLPKSWLPDGTSLSFHYGDSSNFIPNLSGGNIRGNPLPSPSGESIDYGFTVTAFDEKLITRVNWYESTIRDEQFHPVSFGYNWTTNVSLIRGWGELYRETLRYDKDGDRQFDNPAFDADGNGIIDQVNTSAGQEYMTLDQLWDLREAYEAIFPNSYLLDTAEFSYTPHPTNPDQNGSFTVGTALWSILADTADVKGEGLEVETIFNPTKNWRISASIVQQKAVRTNLAPGFTEVFTGLMNALESVENAKGSIFGANKLRTPLQDPLAGGTGWNQLILGAYAGNAYFSNTALDGADNPEVREWRANIITNYRFTDGKMRGWNIGSAYRYVDSASIGYALTTLPGDVIAPDVTKPIQGQDDHTYDLWFGRSKKIKNDTINWRVQLNIRNLFAGDGVEVIRAQPDGTAARVKAEAPRTFVLTNTFEF